MKKNKNITKILYVYDFKGWAVYNVGKLWLSQTPDIEVTFIDSYNFKANAFNEYDLVWFGYYDLFLYHFCRFKISKNNFNKCIISIHDPLEVFPQKQNWKNLNLNLKKWWRFSSWYRWTRFTILKKIKNIVTTSNELQLILKANGIQTFLIPTMSSLPQKNKSKLKTEKASILSIFENYPRKNVELLNSIKKNCEKVSTVSFDTKIGKKILPAEKYRELLDNHEIYICTSYQEGGPLPAMDAMQRGAIVISTPVGQIQDIIKHGENGFICKTKKEFTTKITLLANDLDLLHKMRKNSLDTIVELRDRNKIKSLVVQTINIIKLENNQNTFQKLTILSTLYFIIYCISLQKTKFSQLFKLEEII